MHSIRCLHHQRDLGDRFGRDRVSAAPSAIKPAYKLGKASGQNLL